VPRAEGTFRSHATRHAPRHPARHTASRNRRDTRAAAAAAPTPSLARRVAQVVCRGKWSGLSAGGATNFGTWRQNPQWVIRPRREAMKMFATLTQLNAAGRQDAEGAKREGYSNAIGLYVFTGVLAAARRARTRARRPSMCMLGPSRSRVTHALARRARALAPCPASRRPPTLRHARPLPSAASDHHPLPAGNGPPDDSRRKLYLANEDELVAMREPAYKRTISLEFTLEPSETPYVVMPCTFAPGCEGEFALTIHCDDLDDDGVPDFDMLPIGPPKDWHCATVSHAWAGELAGGARMHDTWRNNPQFYLLPSARSRMFIFLDLAPPPAGAPALPPIQLCVARGDGMFKIAQVGAGNMCAESEYFADDGLSIELSLGKASRKAPYVIVPCTQTPGDEARFSVSVYSEHPFEFASFDGTGKFPLCNTCQSLCPQVRAPRPSAHSEPQLTAPTLSITHVGIATRAKRWTERAARTLFADAPQVGRAALAAAGGG
jgi:hypothetical protein